MSKTIGVLILLGLVLMACAAPTPQIVKETVSVPQTVVVEKTVVVQAPTATPKPPEPAKPPAPVAVLRIVPVAANAAVDPNVLTATLQYVTSTIVGPAKTTAAMGSPGLPNVPISVPVSLSASATDPKANITKTQWTLTVPPGSKAALSSPAAASTKFTPDVVGIYKVDVVVSNATGASPMASVQINAGTYVGVTAGNCKQCHPSKVEEWAKTGHALIFSDEIDNKRDAPNPTHYSESCTRCHTTGWYIAPYNGSGGFEDAKAKANWTFPTQDQINKQNNWAGVPETVKNMANIQCEVCHGPASEHLKGKAVMASSQDEGVCNVCHNGGGHHLKGTDLKNAKHSTGTSFEEVNGPARQACVRCHSGYGYASFLENPKNMASWNNEEGRVVCATCHDPHDEKNMFQLRVVGKPIEITFDAKDVGLSATCFECHNARTNPADSIKSTFPHYSSVAEFISDTGGVTYGQTIANSPHATLVGVAPIKNAAFAKDPTTNEFMFSKLGDKKGNTPGPCIVCHMWPTIEDSKDPNYHKVGSHSFNTVSPDGKFAYTAACKQCHGDLKDFNLKAKADYDGNGKIEGVQDEVKGLLNVLWKALEAKGVKKVDTGYPYATLPKDAQGNTDDKIDNAFYNFRTVYGVMWATGSNGNEGKAQAVHNFKRAVMLLQLSLKDLSGSLPAGMTEMK